MGAISKEFVTIVNLDVTASSDKPGNFVESKNSEEKVSWHGYWKYNNV
jgi:hypothetical protein